MTTKNHGRGELSLETVGNAVSGRIFRQVNFGGVFSADGLLGDSGL